ncbi:MAG: TonB-dependent receptor [Cellvibrionaceae bacterium]|nr:TonB-dependent receptor [Cellvibrionaceae bacterium]
MKMNRLALALKMTALSSLGFSHMPAFAQGAENGEIDVEEVTVTGIQRSLQNSRDAKKETDSISDVISAEDVGRFPDINVAESLSRLPGFSVDRQFGEGEKVSIHGTDPALNRVFIDGHAIASADWGGNPADITGRTFNYALLAPEIIGQAKVFKSPEAWIDEGSIGGTVIIETRKPFDLDAGELSMSIGYAYNDRSEKGNPRGSALYSWKNDSDTFGFLLAGTYDKQSLNRAGIEYFGYNPGSMFAPSFETTTNAEGDVIGVSGPNINGSAPTLDSYNEMLEAVVPCCINFAYFDQKRERLGMNLAMQWAPSDNTEFTLTGLRIEGDYTNHNRALYSVASWAAGRSSDISVGNGIVTGATANESGFIPFDPENPDAETNYDTNAQYDSFARETKITINSINLDGEWSNDAWTLSGKLGYTDASGGKDPETGVNFNYTGAFTFEFDQNGTHQDYALNPEDPSVFFRGNLTEQTVNGQQGYFFQVGGSALELYTDEEVYAQADALYELSGNFFTALRFGVKASSHENASEAFGNKLMMTEASFMSDFETTLSPDGLFDGLGASGNAIRFVTLTDAGVFQAHREGITTDWEINYGLTFKVKEDITAVYLQGDFETGALRGNLGVRLVDTQARSDYWLFNDLDGSWSEESSDNDYSRALPSLNLVYSVSEDFLLKAGTAKVIARPRYGELAGSFNLDNNRFTGGGGNPELKPYESTNFGFSAEYYFGDSGLVAAEYFLRDVSSYIVTTTEDRQLFNTDTGELATYSVTSPFNAESAKVTGVALQGQTNIAYGFGISANITLADANVPSDGYNMPFLSSETYSISPFYQSGPWQARVSYSYRSPYFTRIGRLDSRDFTDEYTQVDFSASYQVSDNLSVTLRGSNLLDETYYQFSAVEIAPTSFYKNGRQFAFGLSYRM